ncbi:Site-specific recombinase XerD [Cnuella takakiae]|uniref:Site-specific recombinase XerD n=1 Tax=Cnuella takakiae TaxID=1302690 RepID=A0A1M5A9H7_9BACT|nr:tyrosine-type recombinase/integrase [Cnuella takakiae]OLY92042.1 hypothetical protein BUE76_09145 [Cnuella takakiae]SHF26970.1 Site-specific recombinase XerD [Cnuella takakiae]
MGPKLTLRPLILNGAECIALQFAPDKITEGLVRRIPKVKWSQPHRCWYLPMTPEAYRKAHNLLANEVAWEETALRQYGERRKAIMATYPQKDGVLKPATIANSPAWQLSDHNLSELVRFVQQIKLQAYSNSTLTTYRNELLQLMKLLKKRAIDSLTADDMRRYMVYCMEKEGISEQTAHSRINAIKFYFEQVLGRDKFFWEIPRPKKPVLLPKVLGERELERLFVAAGTLKHKAILFTAYSAGLRVSEVVGLRLADIDSDRMQILVAQSKGKKDRYVGLSVLLLDILRAYIRHSSPRPQVFLFEGPVAGTPLSARTAQHVFNEAKKAAGIRKQVSFHALRHSFATHLLEKGIDIKYIKDLLGHFQIRTTERYLHVKRQDLIQIVNPLDELYRNKTFRL